MIVETIIVSLVLIWIFYHFKLKHLLVNVWRDEKKTKHKNIEFILRFKYA